MPPGNRLMDGLRDVPCGRCIAYARCAWRASSLPLGSVEQAGSVSAEGAVAQMADTQGEAHRIGELIRQARVLQGRSQADVAADLGYHQSKISRLEGGRGTDDIRVLREVARILRIP